MATSASTIEHLLDQLSAVGNLRTKKMFGEYALYCKEKVVALICDNQCYVKPTEAGRAVFGDGSLAPPYPGAKLYFFVEIDRWEKREWFARLIRVTEESLPVPKKKSTLH